MACKHHISFRSQERTHLSSVLSSPNLAYHSAITVPFKSIRPSRVTSQVDVAEIGCLSQVTGWVAGCDRPIKTVAQPWPNFGYQILAEFWRVSQVQTWSGRIQNFVHRVTGHTPGRTDLNGTVPVRRILKLSSKLSQLELKPMSLLLCRYIVLCVCIIR